jgi:hypothetical protein
MCWSNHFKEATFDERRGYNPLSLSQHHYQKRGYEELPSFVLSVLSNGSHMLHDESAYKLPSMAPLRTPNKTEHTMVIDHESLHESLDTR